MRMKLIAALVATTAFVPFAPAQAGVLFADTGWQSDTLSAVGDPTDDSPWTFTISLPSILSVVDCCIVGDTYTLSGDVAGVTTFYAGSPSDVQASGSYFSEWIDAQYSKIALSVGPGTYTFSITGDGVGGVPAGLGIRLDTAPAIPEPEVWAMLLSGFGGLGLVLRRRRRVTVSYA